MTASTSTSLRKPPDQLGPSGFWVLSDSQDLRPTNSDAPPTPIYLCPERAHNPLVVRGPCLDDFRTARGTGQQRRKRVVFSPRHEMVVTPVASEGVPGRSFPSGGAFTRAGYLSGGTRAGPNSARPDGFKKR
jgi:hypothetical protein